MACKNDDSWPDGGTFTKIGDCVDWPKLVSVRLAYNKVWEALKSEERANEYRWGWGRADGKTNDPDQWSTGCKNRREEIEGLADIRGYISIRLNSSGHLDAVAFVIDGGDILRRLSYQGSPCTSQSCGGCKGKESEYEYSGGARGMGQWAAYLKDPCHGCTAFQLSNVCDVRKEDIVYQTVVVDVIEDYYGKGPNTACPINRHWQWLYNPSSPGPLEGYPNICNVALEWRVQGLPIFQSALSLFPAKRKCALETDPYTTVAENCCGLNAYAHWTEEWDPADQGSAHKDCPPDYVDPSLYAPGNIIRYSKRRIKYIDLYNGFFGDVTQIIRASHLNYIWGLLAGISDRSLRQCKKEKCEFKHTQDHKDIWVYKDQVLIEGDKESLKQRDTGGSCDECDRPAGGQPICSCEWDDLNHILTADFPTTSCMGQWGSTSELGGPRPGKGPPYLIYGPVDDSTTSCTDCLGNCCYNCKCESGISEIDCQKIKEVKGLKKEIKNGPIWMGVYGYKDSCKSCSKRGEIKPCNGFAPGDENSDIGLSPEVNKFITCGFKSKCCKIGPPKDEDGNIDTNWKCSCYDEKSCNWECCETVTKCECDDRGGTWTTPSQSDLQSGSGPSCECANPCFGSSKNGNTTSDKDLDPKTAPCRDFLNSSFEVKVAGMYSCTGSVDDNLYLTYSGGTKESLPPNGTPCADQHSFSFSLNFNKGETVSVRSGSWAIVQYHNINCCLTTAP